MGTPDLNADASKSADAVNLVEDIISMEKNMGLEVNESDVEELIEEKEREFTTEDLKKFYREQECQILEEEEDSTNGENKESLPSAAIKDFLSKWEEVQNFIRKYHPNKTEASRAANILNDTSISYFRKILQKKIPL